MRSIFEDLTTIVLSPVRGRIGLSDERSAAVNNKVEELRQRGFDVAPADGVPGLWRVSGHPELTTNQLLSL